MIKDELFTAFSKVDKFDDESLESIYILSKTLIIVELVVNKDYQTSYFGKVLMPSLFLLETLSSFKGKDLLKAIKNIIREKDAGGLK